MRQKFLLDHEWHRSYSPCQHLPNFLQSKTGLSIHSPILKDQNLCTDFIPIVSKIVLELMVQYILCGLLPLLIPW